MGDFFRGWRRKAGCSPQSWKTFFLVTAGMCVIVDGLAAYEVRCKYRNFAIAPGVVAKVEFQNIMTVRYAIGNQQYELREQVSPKYARRAGDNVFVRYEVVRPANSSITSFSAPWMEFGAVTMGLSLLLVFVAFCCFHPAFAD